MRNIYSECVCVCVRLCMIRKAAERFHKSRLFTIFHVNPTDKPIWSDAGSCQNLCSRHAHANLLFEHCGEFDKLAAVSETPNNAPFVCPQRCGVVFCGCVPIIWVGLSWKVIKTNGNLSFWGIYSEKEEFGFKNVAGKRMNVSGEK